MALIKDEKRKALIEETLHLLLEYFGEDLYSVVVFGSVARGESTPESDIDLIVVCKSFPESLSERMEQLSRILIQLDGTEASKRLRKKGINTWIQFHPLNLEEARMHRPIYLDTIEDGIIIFDRDGFIKRVLSSLGKRLGELGARRIFLKDGSWYWDLKPDMKKGEVVEI
ncbi:MAG: nucleotidyltransferase domain-containing protein [Candidatus Bathyarchaeia archaeon]